MLSDSEQKNKQIKSYTQRGWRVLPIAANKKNPACRHGYKDATSDETKIASWFTSNPSLNVGIATGQVSGIVVIDIDPRNGGDESLEQLEGELGKLPETLMQLTAGGGRHFIFKWSEGFAKRQLAAGVDFLSDGGYILAPGSAIDGRSYEWEISTENLEPAELTQAWVDFIRSAKTSGETKSDTEIQNGYRNQSLTSLAGYLRAGGLSRSEILSAISTANNERCKPPLPSSEVRQIAASVSGYVAQSDIVQDSAIGNRSAEDLLKLDKRPPSKLEQSQYIPVDIETLTASHPKLHEPVIEGLLRQGETLNVIASPKVGKSFLVGGLVWSIVSGQHWLSMEVQQGQVLVIDNELHPSTLVNRYQRIAESMEIPHDQRSQLETMPLRGKGMTIDQLYYLPIQPGKYRLIVLDALYRFIPKGTNENDNAAMMAIYNEIDWLAELWQCSIVIIHHSSKGDQSSKGLTDVGAGAGAIARAADSHLIIRPHEEQGHFVLEAVTRSFKSPEPLSIRFDYPLWSATTLTPEVVKKGGREAAQQKTDTETRANIIKALKGRPLSSGQLRSKLGFGQARVNRGLWLLQETGDVESKRIKRNGKKMEVFRLKEPEEIIREIR